MRDASPLAIGQAGVNQPSQNIPKVETQRKVIALSTLPAVRHGRYLSRPFFSRNQSEKRHVIPATFTQNIPPVLGQAPEPGPKEVGRIRRFFELPAVQIILTVLVTLALVALAVFLFMQAGLSRDQAISLGGLALLIVAVILIKLNAY